MKHIAVLVLLTQFTAAFASVPTMYFVQMHSTVIFKWVRTLKSAGPEKSV